MMAGHLMLGEGKFADGELYMRVPRWRKLLTLHGGLDEVR
jgi:hypothetical protein